MRKVYQVEVGLSTAELTAFYKNLRVPTSERNTFFKHIRNVLAFRLYVLFPQAAQRIVLTKHEDNRVFLQTYDTGITLTNHQSAAQEAIAQAFEEVQQVFHEGWSE